MADFLFVTATAGHLRERLAQLGADAARKSRSRSAPFLRHSRGRLFLSVGAPETDAAFFDGTAVFGDRLFTAGQEPPGDAEGRGAYVRLRRRADHAVSVEIDPLGLYPVFYSAQDGAFGVSNTIAMLAETLGLMGLPAAKDVSLFAYYVTIGGAPGGRTGYHGIRMLQAGEAIEVSGEGKAAFRRRSVASLLYSDRSYRDLLEELIHHIRSNVRALAGAPFEHVVCDLSGGMDSRVVLAACLAEGPSDRILFNTDNRYPNPDANTGAMIRAEFGLRRAVNLGPPLRSLAPVERMRRCLAWRGGLMEEYFPGASAESELNLKTLRMAGALGELMRKFWSGGWTAGGATRKRVKDMVKRSAGHVASETLLRQRAEIRQAARALAREGVRAAHIGDALYLAARNPHHFGVGLALSRSRVAPLYSPLIAQIGYALEEADREANKAGFDVMVALCPRLAELPFAGKSWSPRVMSGVPSPITVESPSYFSSDEKPVSLFRPVRTSRAPTAAEEQLKALGARSNRFHFIRLMEDLNQSGLKLDASLMAPVFDARSVERFLGQDLVELAEAKQTMLGQRLLAAWLWAADLEIHDPL